MQLIENSLPRVVSGTPKHPHISPILKSIHWLMVPERIHFKALSPAYNSLHYSQPTYLRELFTIQQSCSTQSPSCLSLSRLLITSPAPLSISRRAFHSKLKCHRFKNKYPG